MPFTPFHFGVGAALKAAAPAHFSFAIFCYSQIVIDLESAYRLFRGDYPVHGFFHSYIGAAVMGLVCGVTGFAGARWVARSWREEQVRVHGVFERRPDGITWWVAFVSAYLGTFSHVFLDSLMHPDMAPMSPFSSANPLLHLISVPALHLLCVGLGVIGVLILQFRSKFDRRRAGRR